MPNTSENNQSTVSQDDKVCQSGGPSNPTNTTTTTTTTTAVVASLAVEVDLEEVIVSQITGQSEAQTSVEEKKDGGKKRSAAETNGGDKSDKPAKKAKTTSVEEREIAGGPATPSNIPDRMASNDPLKSVQGLKIKSRRMNSRRVPDNHGKNEPYTPAGTKFVWADNCHVDRAKAKVDTKDRSRYKLRLKATDGIEYTFVYTRRKIIDWRKKADVAHLNTWRNQLIKRKLDNETARDEGQRPHWSEKEKVALSGLIRDRIRKKQRQLNAEDWAKIAEKHNERFRGVTVHVGEKLPGSINKGKLTDGKVLKKAHVLVDRSSSAIKSQSSRWPDTTEMIQEELRKVGIVQVVGSDGGEVLEGEGEEGESEESGEELDLGLEDPSDDEDDRQRPASNQAGAYLVPTSA